MENKITEMVFVLDKSGSMSGFEEDTVGGFNSMIERQRSSQNAAYVSTVLFSNSTSVLHDRVKLEEVGKMMMNDYVVGGATALLDAIGSSIEHIRNIHKYARTEDVPERTIFVITTDGMENASHMYDAKTVKRMIKEQTEKCGWEFIFLAANIDAIETAGNIGIRRERAVGFEQTNANVRRNYEAVGNVITAFAKKTPKERSDVDIKEFWEEKENGR